MNELQKNKGEIETLRPRIMNELDGAILVKRKKASKGLQSFS